MFENKEFYAPIDGSKWTSPGWSHVPPTSDITPNRMRPFEISFQAPRVF